MYKSTNMLRTRRRDNNVKPNRRLDRKSSRGMIYENEELRLKTININAEIERGQSDIKKLKRENELLKKEIWCLRDEYEKLDKLLKDKEIELSSSSTTCSSSSSGDSESCSSCSGDEDDGGGGEDGDGDGEWRQVEATQNRENVQKTAAAAAATAAHMKKLCDGMDQLSVVLEEPVSPTATDNSSPRARSVTPDPHHHLRRPVSLVLKADQSYPPCDTLQRAATLPVQSMPGNFFSPIEPCRRSHEGESQVFEQREAPLYPEQLYHPAGCVQQQQQPHLTPQQEYYGDLPPPYRNGGEEAESQYYAEHVATPPSHRRSDNAATDMVGVAKTCGSTTEYYTSEKRVDTAATTFYQNMVLVPKHQQNGGTAGANLQGMAKTSTDLLVKLDNRDFAGTTPARSTFSNGGNLEELLNDIETISRDILHISTAQNTSADAAFHHVNGSGDFLSRIEADNEVTYLQNPELAELDRDHAQGSSQLQQSLTGLGNNNSTDNRERPYKSELSVTLVPTPMALMGNGTDKYRRMDPCHSRSLDDLNSVKSGNIAGPATAGVRFFQGDGGRTCSMVDSSSAEYRQHFVQEEERLQQRTDGGPCFVQSSSSQYSSPVAQRRAAAPPPPQLRTTAPSTPAPPSVGHNTPHKHHEASSNPFFFGKLTEEFFNRRYNPDNYLRIDKAGEEEETGPSPAPSPQTQRRLAGSSRSPRPDAVPTTTMKTATSTENVEDLRFRTGSKPDLAAQAQDGQRQQQQQQQQTEKPKGLSMRRKVSIHFKGRAKDKNATGVKKTGGIEGVGGGGEKKHPLFDVKFSSSSEGGGKSGARVVNSSAESSAAEPKTPSGSDSAPKTRSSRRSASASPERSQHQQQPQQQQQQAGGGGKGEKKGHKKHKKSSAAGRNRRNTAASVERLPLNRERSFSICTDRSNAPGVGFQYSYDSDRDESLSSCDTGIKTRKMSSLSNIPLTGKVPWCGCWGNGCL